MGAMTPMEKAIAEMSPRWRTLSPVAARDGALRQFLIEELGGHRFDAAGLNAGFKLCHEFNMEIWQHEVPGILDMIEADKAGRLEEHIAEIEAAWEARGGRSG